MRKSVCSDKYTDHGASSSPDKQPMQRPTFPKRSSNSSTKPATVTSQYNSKNYTIESSGSLPIQVREALSSWGRDENNSVYFGENGWAWFVCCAKLFIWKFKQIASKHLCKEITLQSGASTHHHAQLIWVGPSTASKDSGSVSMIVVTAGGVVKYWPNIIQSTASPKLTLDIPQLNDNEEFVRVVAIKEKGYLAVTSSGVLYHLNHVGAKISFTRLDNSKGVFAGLGRRVSSLFFSSDYDTNVVDLVLLQTSVGLGEVIMLTATTLQRRRISLNGRDNVNARLISEVDICDMLSEPISRAVGDIRKDKCRIWPLDVAVFSNRNDIAILVACEDRRSETSIVLRIAICFCPFSILEGSQDNLPASSKVEVVLLDRTEIMGDEDDCETFSFRLFIPNATDARPHYAIIWRSNEVILKSFDGVIPLYEETLFTNSADLILGAGQFNAHALLFESTNGFLSIDPVVSHRDVEFSQTRPAISTTQTPISSLPSVSMDLEDRIIETDQETRHAQRLQAAFIHFNQGNIDHACSIIGEAFSGTDRVKSLNHTVLILSQQLIDDYPALDPRWAESLPQDASDASTLSSPSLILQHQLKDKQKAHQLFLTFLIEVAIWDTLGISEDTAVKSPLQVQWMLIEHGEKLAAAIALQEIHVQYQAVLDSTIRKVLERRGNFPNKSGLTPQDIFYREISQIQGILECLLDVEEDMISNCSLSSREIFTMIAGVNEVFKTMLTAAHCFRTSKNVSHKGKGVEFCAWTVSSGQHSLRAALLRQHSIIYNHGITKADDSQQRTLMHIHSVDLADIMLRDYLWQIESLKSVPSLSARADEVFKLFQMHRTAVISSILESGLMNKAQNLAEKYQDFDILLKICDHTNDQKQLFQYMKQFEDYGFTDFFFGWFLERGKFRKLLQYTTSKEAVFTDCSEKLSEFLSSHPKVNWLHEIQTGDLMSAHKTLLYLATIENDNCMKKNHYVSLSKLAVAFSDKPDSVIEEHMFDVNSQQSLLKFQETLPNVVLKKMGVTLDDMPVFSIEKLIKLYVGDSNVNSNEVDFMKALDLLQILEEQHQTEDEPGDAKMSEAFTVDDLKFLIWCKAILKDQWGDIEHKVDPLRASSHTILSKTLALASEAGVLSQCFPDVDDLLQREVVASINHHSTSQHLVRLNFEHYKRQLTSSN